MVQITYLHKSFDVIHIIISSLTTCLPTIFSTILSEKRCKQRIFNQSYRKYMNLMLQLKRYIKKQLIFIRSFMQLYKNQSSLVLLFKISIKINSFLYNCLNVVSKTFIYDMIDRFINDINSILDNRSNNPIKR